MIITLGGFPTGDAVLPMLTAIIIIVRTGTGLRFVTSLILIMTGVISNTVDTLSRNNADTIETKLKLQMSGHTLPFVF